MAALAVALAAPQASLAGGPVPSDEKSVVTSDHEGNGEIYLVPG